MARSLKKMWRNGRGGRWTTRIRWYESKADGIRLDMEDSERRHSYYPQSQNEAEHVWQLFRNGSPVAPSTEPVVTILLSLTKHAKFRKMHGLDF